MTLPMLSGLKDQQLISIYEGINVTMTLPMLSGLKDADAWNQ